MRNSHQQEIPNPKSQIKRIFIGHWSLVIGHWDLRRRRRGFTLLEILIALFLTSLFSLLLYSSFFTTLSTERKIHKELKAFQQGWTILNNLSIEIESAYSSGEISFSGQKDSLSFCSLASLYEIPDKKRDSNKVNKVKVDYHLSFSEGKTFLFREESSLSSSKSRLINLGEVKSLSFLYFDGDDWKDEWKGSDLPKAVEIRLLLPEEKEFSIIAPIYIGQKWKKS